jgi:hypothetical protein
MALPGMLLPSSLTSDVIPQATKEAAPEPPPEPLKLSVPGDDPSATGADVESPMSVTDVPPTPKPSIFQRMGSFGKGNTKVDQNKNEQETNESSAPAPSAGAGDALDQPGSPTSQAASPRPGLLTRMLSKGPLDENGQPLPSDQLTELKDIKAYAKNARKERNKARLEDRRRQLKERRTERKLMDKKERLTQFLSQVRKDMNYMKANNPAVKKKQQEVQKKIKEQMEASGMNPKDPSSLDPARLNEVLSSDLQAEMDQLNMSVDGLQDMDWADIGGNIGGNIKKLEYIKTFGPNEFQVCLLLANTLNPLAIIGRKPEFHPVTVHHYQPPHIKIRTIPMPI